MQCPSVGYPPHSFLRCCSHPTETRMSVVHEHSLWGACRKKCLRQYHDGRKRDRYDAIIASPMGRTENAYQEGKIERGSEPEPVESGIGMDL
jgi:hypothetical protein